MDISIIAMTVVGLSTSLISFLLGTIYGRNTAYKTISTYQAADMQDGARPSLGDQYRAHRELGRAYRKGLQRGGEGLADE